MRGREGVYGELGNWGGGGGLNIFFGARNVHQVFISRCSSSDSIAKLLRACFFLWVSLRWIQEGFKGGFSRSTETPFGPLFWAIRFGFWGSARLYLRLLVRNSDFRPVTLTFGPESESFH